MWRPSTCAAMAAPSFPPIPAACTSWNRFRDDVIQMLEQAAPKGAVLGGHSMGATVALLVAGKRPDLVRGLVLADPVLMKPGAVSLAQHAVPQHD